MTIFPARVSGRFTLVGRNTMEHRSDLDNPSHAAAAFGFVIIGRC